MKGGSDPLNLPLNPEFEDPNDLISPNDWTCAEWDNSLKDNLALDAHWAAAMVYDYFWQQHNRNSFDNQGSVIDVYVHHQLMDYAAWLGTTLSPFGSVFGMVFGDGNSTQFDGLVSLDIVAHEFAHGITQSTSNLLSSGISESPAINEGLSDIWGAVVEDWLLNTVGFIDPEGDKDPWLAAEEMRLDFAAQRSLKNPKNTSMAQSMADTYNGLNYSGLRGKSGIMSHWFYLLSEGSSATDEINDNGDPFSLTGIGINKAADIVYYAQTVYFTKYTDYKDARQYTLEAAKDLFGQCSVEALAVAESWDAVGVDGNSISPFVAGCGDVQNGLYQNSTLEVSSLFISSGETYCFSTPVLVDNGSKVVFRAGNEIRLSSGFRVAKNANFHAYITNCTTNSNFRTLDNNKEESSEYFSDMNNSFIVYPNPSNGQFIIDIANVNNTFIEVYDLTGRLIWQKIVVENKNKC